jgi:hypothetical protein
MISLWQLQYTETESVWLRNSEQSITNPKWKPLIQKQEKKTNKEGTQNWLSTYVASIVSSIIAMLPS